MCVWIVWLILVQNLDRRAWSASVHLLFVNYHHNNNSSLSWHTIRVDETGTSKTPLVHISRRGGGVFLGDTKFYRLTDGGGGQILPIPMISEWSIHWLNVDVLSLNIVFVGWVYAGGEVPISCWAGWQPCWVVGKAGCVCLFVSFNSTVDQYVHGLLNVWQPDLRIYKCSRARRKPEKWTRRVSSPGAGSSSEPGFSSIDLCVCILSSTSVYPLSEYAINRNQPQPKFWSLYRL